MRRLWLLPEAIAVALSDCFLISAKVFLRREITNIFSNLRGKDGFKIIHPVQYL